jgi:hypothetical protein
MSNRCYEFGLRARTRGERKAFDTSLRVDGKSSAGNLRKVN